MPTRVEPVEQGRPGAADVQVAGWGGGETEHWYFGFFGHGRLLNDFLPERKPKNQVVFFTSFTGLHVPPLVKHFQPHLSQLMKAQATQRAQESIAIR